MYSISFSTGFPFLMYLRSNANCSLLLTSVTSSAWMLNFATIAYDFISSIICSCMYSFIQSGSSFWVVFEIYEAFWPHTCRCCWSSWSPASILRCLPQNSTHLMIEVRNFLFFFHNFFFSNRQYAANAPLILGICLQKYIHFCLSHQMCFCDTVTFQVRLHMFPIPVRLY